MLTENLKKLRKEKGFTQDELSTRLNVVRQTISKWEKGLSVPDAETLIKIADIYEVSVSDLLGTVVESENKNNAIADQLSRINEHLAKKRRLTRRIWIVLLVILSVFILLNLVGVLFYSMPGTELGGGGGGADLIPR